MGTYNIRTIGVILAISIAFSLATSTALGTGNGTIPPVAGRLLVLGDSLASGLYASSENTTYARLVADGMGMQLARRHVSTLELAVVEWQGVKSWRPEIIVLEVGLNDVSHDLVNDNWGIRYHNLVSEMRGSGATVIVVTTFWGGIQPHHPKYTTYMTVNQVIRETPGAILADVWKATVDCDYCVSSASDESYFPPNYRGDGFHPNDAGHVMIAATIIEAIRGCKCDTNAPEPKHYNYYLPHVGE